MNCSERSKVFWWWFDIRYPISDIQSQWGVKKLYCEDCDKYHINFEQYLTYKKEKIDFNQCGIEGYKDEEEEIIYGSVIRPKKVDDKIDFITND